MKIISKYKDYYDYLQGFYGVDNKLVLDRRDGMVINEAQANLMHFKLVICGKITEGLMYKNKAYYGSGLMLLGFVKKIHSKYGKEEFIGKNFYSGKIKGEFEHQNRSYEIEEESYTDKDNLNEKHRCPILLIVDKQETPCPFPRLSDFAIVRKYPSKEMWILLSAWLSAQIPEAKVPVGSDAIRIAQHGFSVKESFRPKMKKKK